MATTAAVLHYTAMARAAGILGRVRNLPCPGDADPGANDDDDSISPEQAEDDARGEFLATPAQLAFSIGHLCQFPDALPVQNYDELAVIDGDASQLLAYALGGSDNRLRLMALDLLADKLAEHGAKDIAARAAELVVQQ